MGGGSPVERQENNQQQHGLPPRNMTTFGGSNEVEFVNNRHGVLMFN